MKCSDQKSFRLLWSAIKIENVAASIDKFLLRVQLMSIQILMREGIRAGRMELMNVFILFVIAFQRRPLKDEWAKGQKLENSAKIRIENYWLEISENYKYKLSAILEAVNTTLNLFWGDNIFLER